MFETLQERLSGVLDKLRGRGSLSEADVGEAMREVRIALLEADVALPVVKDFIAQIKDRTTFPDEIAEPRGHVPRVSLFFRRQALCNLLPPPRILRAPTFRSRRLLRRIVHQTPSR